MKQAWQNFNKAVFGYSSPVTFGVFRILLSGIFFIDLLMLSTGFDAWYTERGYFPIVFQQRWAGGVPRIDLLDGVTDTRVTMLFFALVMVASLLSTLGLFTRVSTIIQFLGVVTLHHRNPEILHSGDTLMRQFLFFIAIGPSGAACSLDRLIGLRRGTAPIPHKEVSVWPERLVQFQLAVLYFTTVWDKWRGVTWRNGTAFYYPSQLHEFDRLPLPHFLYMPPMAQVMTWGTLFIELALATLVFSKPLRKWVLLGGILLHAGIEWSMNVPLFEWIIVAGYVCFYDGYETSAWWSRIRPKLHLPNQLWGIPLASPTPPEAPQAVANSG